MDSTIVQAIANRRVLSIHYNGGARIIEPHCYGLGSSGQELLRCFQVSGHSNSNTPTGWKLMTASNIRNISSQGDTFPGPRPGYNPNRDPAIPTIYGKL